MPPQAVGNSPVWERGGQDFQAERASPIRVKAGTSPPNIQKSPLRPMEINLNCPQLGEEKIKKENNQKGLCALLELTR